MRSWLNTVFISCWRSCGLAVYSKIEIFWCVCWTVWKPAYYECARCNGYLTDWKFSKYYTASGPPQSNFSQSSGNWAILHIRPFYSILLDRFTVIQDRPNATIPARGATSSSFRGEGAIFMKFHSMTSSWLFNRGTTFSQTVTYNNNVFLPADTKSIVDKHTHSAQRCFIKTERFTTALEAESPVSSEMSDFMPYAHAQSNILHVKCAEKTDD